MLGLGVGLGFLVKRGGGVRVRILELSSVNSI